MPAPHRFLGMKWQSFLIPVACFSGVLIAAFATEDVAVRVALCVMIIAVCIPAHFFLWWLVRYRLYQSGAFEHREKPKKPWNYSLRTLLLVATFAPAMLAGVYFGIRLVWILANVAPTLDTSFADHDNPNARSFKASWYGEHMTIFVGTKRIIEFDSTITKFSPAEQTQVRVTKRYSNSVEVTGLQTGESQLTVWSTDGEKAVIDISVIDK